MRTIDQNFEAPKRIFSTRQIGKILELKPKVDCECPNHLASIVSSLCAFEEYSKNCEDRNEADAKIHSMLYRETANARGVMEDALKKLCDFEQIALD